MKPFKLLIKTNEDTRVHWDAEWNDYTLCGLDTMGDSQLGIKPAKITNKQVNCGRCLAVVDLVKRIILK